MARLRSAFALVTMLSCVGGAPETDGVSQQPQGPYEECSFGCGLGVWPNVSETECVEGICRISKCEYFPVRETVGFDCNGVSTDGCEVLRWGRTTSDRAFDLGLLRGDEPGHEFAEAGWGEAWLRFDLVEARFNPVSGPPTALLTLWQEANVNDYELSIGTLDDMRVVPTVLRRSPEGSWELRADGRVSIPDTMTWSNPDRAIRYVHVRPREGAPHCRSWRLQVRSGS